jgi:hypothetical protein
LAAAPTTFLDAEAMLADWTGGLEAPLLGTCGNDHDICHGEPINYRMTQKGRAHI